MLLDDLKLKTLIGSISPQDHPTVSLWDYLKEELTAADFETTQELKRERVANFLSVPIAFEKVYSVYSLERKDRAVKTPTWQDRPGELNCHLSCRANRCLCLDILCAWIHSCTRLPSYRQDLCWPWLPFSATSFPGHGFQRPKSGRKSCSVRRRGGVRFVGWIFKLL